MTDQCKMAEGKVVQIYNDGLGVLRYADRPRDMVFTFDKIEGYKGEYPAEMGLKKGRQVQFFVDNDIVQFIKLV